MNEFWLYFNLGLTHVLDINAYDHVLFLIALIVPYSFKDWKRVLLLVTMFTLGHTLALILAVYQIIVVQVDIIEFLIPVTIFITAFYHILTAGKAAQKGIGFAAFITLFFGIIHGLGFSNYFKSILPGSASDKLLPLLEFAVGIEAAQLIVVLIVLIISTLVQTVFRFSLRDWTLVAAAFVMGVVLPMLIESKIFE